MFKSMVSVLLVVLVVSGCASVDAESGNTDIGKVVMVTMASDDPIKRCGVLVAPPPDQYVVGWDGKCANGLISGVGTLILRDRSDGSETRLSGRFNKGRPVGLIVGVQGGAGGNEICSVDFDDLERSTMCVFEGDLGL